MFHSRRRTRDAAGWLGLPPAQGIRVARLAVVALADEADVDGVAAQRNVRAVVAEAAGERAASFDVVAQAFEFARMLARTRRPVSKTRRHCSASFHG